MNYITTCSNIKTILMYTHHHIITFWSTSTLTRTLVQLYDVVRYRSMSDVCFYCRLVRSSMVITRFRLLPLPLCLCFFLFFSLLILLSLERLLSFIFNLYLCLPTLFFSLSPCLWFDSIIIILYVQCILVFISLLSYICSHLLSLLSSLLLSFDSFVFLLYSCPHTLLLDR